MKYMLHHQWKLFIALPLAGLLAGCCCAGGGSRRAPKKRSAPEPIPEGMNVYVDPVPSSIRSVAVMPFRASTELIGISISDLFVTELLRTGRYQLVERSQLSRVLGEAEVALSGLTEARAIELGNMLGADGVIIGSVDEYGTIAIKGKALAVVGLSVRLIDCNSGRVMWSASLSDCADVAHTPLSSQARCVVRSTVIALKQKWKVQPYAPRGSRAPARARPTDEVAW
ncbi:MAG: CsgG/HfaB family protein [Kiritimatiellae bacterium]|nr:CsgG/HfaB family protein [Kiritimatiellia bacterium]MDD4341859.1 CsgG/HfaB family protein [Kiritimatiellia bacterium]MDY0150210.1 CsgG/HfaB family protein [Kiritimatiellia bacterium]